MASTPWCTFARRQGSILAENPLAYAHSNLLGFTNIIENCRQYPLRHLVYASSSSVYGGNTKVPFSEDDNVDHPVSFYAATKGQ